MERCNSAQILQVKQILQNDSLLSKIYFGKADNQPSRVSYNSQNVNCQKTTNYLYALQATQSTEDRVDARFFARGFFGARAVGEVSGPPSASGFRAQDGRSGFTCAQSTSGPFGSGPSAFSATPVVRACAFSAASAF